MSTKNSMQLCIDISQHVPGVPFSVRFNNFDRTAAFIGVIHSYSSHPFLCALGEVALDEVMCTHLGGILAHPQR